MVRNLSLLVVFCINLSISFGFWGMYFDIWVTNFEVNLVSYIIFFVFLVKKKSEIVFNVFFCFYFGVGIFFSYGVIYFFLFMVLKLIYIENKIVVI